VRRQTGRRQEAEWLTLGLSDRHERSNRKVVTLRPPEEPNDGARQFLSVRPSGPPLIAESAFIERRLTGVVLCVSVPE
jgi:hypothetical protein